MMTNMFGGKNPHGLYVPLSPDEQEVISRLIEGDNLELNIENWSPENVEFIFGDLRLGIRFQLICPELRIQQFFQVMHLHLKTRDGHSLFKESKELNPPVLLTSGMVLTFQWDIALHSISSNLVKELKPGASGLTSRRQDKDTGDMTREGNMHLSSLQKKVLHEMEESAKEIREQDRKAVEGVGG